MSYERVIPRDLFNEANLLKCLGKLYCALEDRGLGHLFTRAVSTAGNPFEVKQNPDDGSISVPSIQVITRKGPILFYRPLNSREPSPLYAHYRWYEDAVPVFEDQWNLTQEFKDMLK